MSSSGLSSNDSLSHLFQSRWNPLLCEGSIKHHVANLMAQPRSPDQPGQSKVLKHRIRSSTRTNRLKILPDNHARSRLVYLHRICTVKIQLQMNLSNSIQMPGTVLTYRGSVSGLPSCYVMLRLLPPCHTLWGRRGVTEVGNNGGGGLA